MLWHLSHHLWQSKTLLKFGHSAYIPTKAQFKPFWAYCLQIGNEGFEPLTAIQVFTGNELRCNSLICLKPNGWKAWGSSITMRSLVWIPDSIVLFVKKKLDLSVKYFGGWFLQKQCSSVALQCVIRTTCCLWAARSCTFWTLRFLESTKKIRSCS